MREVISIHVGQVGCQTADIAWEQYCWISQISPHAGTGIGPAGGTCFEEMSGGRFVPRAVFMDTDLDPIDGIKKRRSNLFDPSSFVVGKRQCTGVFSRGSEACRSARLECIRKRAEGSDCCEGFVFNGCLGGGTGSGVTSDLQTELDDLYPKKPRMLFALFPTPAMSPSVVDPLNALMATRYCTESSNILVADDVAAVGKVCRELRMKKDWYHNVSHVIAYSMEANLLGLRCPYLTCHNDSLVKMQEQFAIGGDFGTITTSHAPLVSEEHRFVNPCCNRRKDPYTARSVVVSALGAGSLSSYGSNTEQVYAMSVIGRGINVLPKDISAASVAVQDTQMQRDGCYMALGLTHGLAYKRHLTHSDSGIAEPCVSASVLSLSGNVGGLYADIVKKAECMLSKRSYVHWYEREGTSLDDLREHLDGVKDLVGFYKECFDSWDAPSEDEAPQSAADDTRVPGSAASAPAAPMPGGGGQQYDAVRHPAAAPAADAAPAAVGPPPGAKQYDAVPHP
eukprot:TRINITY_DN364_c0_g1_i3.p1 TRINITY_DN364_c0_g1~~TRINITY_DN364_c0_g1_i3.p1  ORF type:complete len:527 (+),score=79.47 TRINITY_DN364_c0_g1_i3:57-1583(+)